MSTPPPPSRTWAPKISEARETPLGVRASPPDSHLPVPVYLETQNCFWP